MDIFFDDLPNEDDEPGKDNRDFTPHESFWRIPAQHGLFENVRVTSFEDSSTLGYYHNAIGQYVVNGDASQLEAFEGVEVHDARGRRYVLETDLDAIHDLFVAGDLSGDPVHDSNTLTK